MFLTKNRPSGTVKPADNVPSLYFGTIYHILCRVCSARRTPLHSAFYVLCSMFNVGRSTLVRRRRIRRSFFVSHLPFILRLGSDVLGLASYIFSLCPNIFAGRNNIALINARNASAAIPTIRNGIDNSHTIGHKKSATSAIGQHKTNNIAHNNNITNTLIARLL
jgi:hypothetical protein